MTNVRVYARIGVRYTPYSGTADGYPKANGVSFVSAGTDDTYLKYADIAFEDSSVTTKVTYSFKAAGDTTHTSGALPFDDVYLVVDYTPPCSDWTIGSTSVYAGSTFRVSIVMTDDNQEYTHKVVVSNGTDTLCTGTGSPGQSTIWVYLSAASLKYFPDTDAGQAFVTLETYNADGILLGTSDPIEIEVLCPDNVIPSTGTLTVSGTNMFGPLYIQGVSSASAAASGWAGTYGSTIRTVTLTGNGKSVTLDVSSGTTTYSDSLTLEAGLLKVTGACSFALSVTDSRGRTAATTQTIDVTAYSPIAVSSTAQGRATRADAGTQDSGYVKVAYDYTPLSYQAEETTYFNTPVLTIYWGTNSIVIDGYASNAQQRFAEDVENGLQKDTMYSIRLHLTDGITSTTVTRTIGTAYAFMRWEPANNAVGFGCYPSTDHCVEIGDGWT